MRNLLLLANGGVWLIIFFIVLFFNLPCGFTACLLILSVIFKLNQIFRLVQIMNQNLLISFNKHRSN